jgi:hypothetical protein
VGGGKLPVSEMRVQIPALQKKKNRNERGNPAIDFADIKRMIEHCEKPCANKCNDKGNCLPSKTHATKAYSR